MAGSNTITVAVKDSAGSTATKSVAYTLSSTSTTGKSYYIAPTGSDSNSGTVTSPWLTVGYASSKLNAGDTLYARGGTYSGQHTSWNSISGTSTAPITFKAYPGETPVFDGGSTVGDFIELGHSKGWIIFDGITMQYYVAEGLYLWSGAHDIIIQNCTVRNIVGGSGCAAIKLDVQSTDTAKTSNVTIQNCTLKDNGSNSSLDQGIYLSGNVQNTIIRNNLIQHTASAGIQFWHGPGANGTLIYNNVIINNAVGIVAGDAAQYIEIYNNTFDHNTYALGFSLSGQDYSSTDPLAGVQNVTIKNNIITNSSYGMTVGSFNVNDITSDNNLWYGNVTDVQWNGSNMTLAQFQASNSNDQHSISANPSYVSASTVNYRLNSGSPAIDKGVTQGKVPNDKDSIARPQGITYDIGAYEYH